ncbi:thioredoxin family protein [Candidatus Roizmanbacteria bacterium]|nr:thioredoxin family protein [Candidatus Roizmanbacteria bacterium]
MITIQFITSLGCAECEKAKSILQEAKSTFPDIEIKEIDLMSQKGISLVTKYGIMANPGIIVNDKFFSAGNLDKEKLFEKIKQLSS